MTTTAMLDKTALRAECLRLFKDNKMESDERLAIIIADYFAPTLSHAGLYELIEKYAVPCWAHDLQQMPRDVIRQHFREFANEVSAAISARAEAAEALEQDAARYRWLREQHWNEAVMAVVCDPKETVRLGTYCPSGQLLDEAIDAARSLSPIKEAGRG